MVTLWRWAFGGTPKPFVLCCDSYAAGFHSDFSCGPADFQATVEPGGGSNRANSNAIGLPVLTDLQAFFFGVSDHS